MSSRSRTSGHKWLLGFSLAAHGALGLAISVAEIKKAPAATAIELANIPHKKKAVPAPHSESAVPKAPEPSRSPARPRAAKPAPPASPPPTAPQVVTPAAALDALPDFGLALSGGSASGLAVSANRSPPPQTATSSAPARKTINTPPLLDGCDEPATKPKPRSVPNPGYTEAARVAGVEGKVRVEVTIDETGRVVSVRVLAGLGYGLDEAALAAARNAEFEPAQRCGKPVRATFNIGMRFTAG
ncbi:MAG TPA: energy transducer TonB [Polyangiaceae bacterium]|nr:energy transducer TonB [Polyangiaceae bacterium]